MSIEQAIKQITGRKLLLAESNTRYLSEMARYLRGIGMEVIEANNITVVGELLRVGGIDVLCMDVDLYGNVAKCLKMAAEPRGSLPPPKIMLTCRAQTARLRLQSMVSPAVRAIVVSPCRPEIMIERLSQVLAAPAAAAPAHPDAHHAMAASVVPTNNSLLLQPALCPFHEKETLVKRYSLRMNKVTVEADFFDVPVYGEAVGNADFVDYNRLCVTVCPECYYASPDPTHFLVPNNKKHVPKIFPAATKYAIAARMNERREALGEVAASFFDETRSNQDAIKSYELAVLSSAALHGTGRKVLTDELARQANYHLRIAHLQQEVEGSQRDRDRHVELASELLKESFAALPDALLARGAYQIVATSIYLNEDREAHQYLTKLAKLARQSSDPTIRQSLDGYLNRAGNAWESRDEHRRPATPYLPTPFIQAA